MSPAESRIEMIEALRQKCVAARGEEMWWIMPLWGGEFRSKRSPGLADVLLALDAIGKSFLCGSDGSLWKERDYNTEFVEGVAWNLSKDSLSDQSDECIQFLHSLLHER